MKKTRILATLLCLMMLVCSLPMMQVSAAADIPWDAIGAVLGTKTSVVHQGTASGWSAMDLLDFTDNFSTDKLTLGTLTAGDSVTYNNTDGAVFTSQAVMYYSATNKLQSYWSPLNLGAWGFRFKLNSNGWLISSATTDWSVGLSEITFAPTYITISTATEQTKVNDFTCGTDWNDALIIKDNPETNDGIYSLWMKKATDSAYTKIYTVTSAAADNGYWKTYGARFDAQNASVAYSTCFQGIDVGGVYDSVEDIMGGSVATLYNFDMNNTSFGIGMIAADTDSEGIYHNGSYTADGWTNGTDWKFLAAKGVNWSPLMADQTNRTAVAFSAKVGKNGFVAQGRKPGGNGRYYYYLASGQAVSCSASTITYSSTLKLDSNWADYLITADSTGNGTALYMKSATLTDGKWVLLSSASDFYSCSVANRGLAFYNPGKDCLVKNVKVYTSDVKVDAATIPTGATELMYEENFDERPAYGNPDGSGLSYENGNLLVTEESGATSQGFWFNMEIPKGGYAEFKTNIGDTIPNLYVFDGSTSLQLYLRPSYGVLYASSSFNMWIGDGNTSYRKWRIARNTDGTYSVYCNVDGDTGWYAIKENIAGKPVGNSKHIRIDGAASATGGAGVVKFDYMKVYGPAITDALTLTDGHGTVIPAEGAKLTFPNALRAIVKADTGKLLVATYTGDNMLKAQIVDVASIADDQVFVNAKVSGGNKIKVFYWDSFTKLNNLKSVATFTY